MATSADTKLEGSLETIQEILVGEHSRVIQKRLSQLDEKLSRELASTQEKASGRTEMLEAFVRKELQTLREDLAREREERGRASQAAADEARALREQMLRQHTALTEELSRLQRSFSTELEGAAALLDSRKPDRNLVAKLLVSMAAAIQEEPSAESKVTRLPPRDGMKSGIKSA
jgi:hypothetical protein